MSDDVLSGRQLGEFVLREQIGEGGYGVVYRSDQPTLKRQVVVKVLRKTDAVAEARFLREARLASQLEHPYAAHVYAFGTEPDGLRWIAMELVSGITLKDWLETRGAMALEQFVPFFECVAEVVQTAHDRGIIHRDLKPSNIMVIERGERLIPKLLDFGIAKTNELIEDSWPVVSAEGEGSDIDRMPTVRGRDTAAPHGEEQTCTASEQLVATHGLTRTGLGIGSRPYMSPEQWSDASTVELASDIYALGVVAYQSLTGRVPFRADNISEYHAQHLHAEVPPLGGSFSTDVDQVIRRALSKRPEGRQVSVLQLASELRDALRAQPREQLRSLAQVWDARSRPAALLLKGGDLLAIGTHGTGELERSFVAASRRQAVRRAYLRRILAVVVLILGGLWYRGTLKAELAEQRTRSAQQIAEAITTQAEIEQGRAALLHGEPEAQQHLVEAYRRSPSQSTAFMLAHALQPTLAEQARLVSSFGRMWSAAFSPSGSQIVTTDDKNAQIWDAQSYRRRFTLSHESEVYGAVYSADGRQLATVAQDGIRIWDTSTGTIVHEMSHKLSGLGSDFYTIALSQDGTLVAAFDATGSNAHIWNVVSGTELAKLHSAGSGFPSLAFSATGQWIATTDGREARVFDTRTWTQVCSVPRVRRLAFDPTSPQLITGGTNGDVSIWEVPSCIRIRHLRDLGEIVDAVAVSPHGQLVAAASRDGVQQVWHTASGELQFQLNARHAKINSLEFDRTSQRLLAAGADGAVVIADVTLGMPVAVLEGPQNEVRVAHFDPTSHRVVGASWDGTARVWSAAAPYYRWGSSPTSDNCGTGSSQVPNRHVIAIRCRDQPTRVWDTSNGRLITELPSVTTVAGDFASAFPVVSATEDRVAIARGNSVEVYELPSGRLLQTIEQGAPVNVVAFALTGRDLVSGAVDGSLIMSSDTGIRITFPPALGGIDSVAVLSDGRIVATDSRKRLRVYDLSSTTLADLDLPGRTFSLRIAGVRAVTVPLHLGAASLPVLLDLERYRVVATLAGHVGSVYSARWIAGERILTAGGDGTVRLWDGTTGQLRQVYRGGSRFLADAGLAPDGFIAAGGADGLLRFWDPVSAHLLWSLQVDKAPLVEIHVDGRDIVTRGYTGELSRWTLPAAEQVIQAWRDHHR